MLPLSHIHVSTEITKRKSPLLVFGSVLPDISWTSDSEIARDQIHYAPKEFYSFVKKNKPEMLELALGVRLHSNIDKGADYYSDDHAEGFAYLEGKKINGKVAKLLGIEPNEKSLVLSHNFIEAGVDLNLFDDMPELFELYKKSMNDLDIKGISSLLADYLNKETDVIEKEVNKFIGFIGPVAYESKDSLGERISLLIKGRLKIDVEANEVFEILAEAKEMTKDSYEGYLNKAIENMKEDFKEVIA